MIFKFLNFYLIPITLIIFIIWRQYKIRRRSYSWFLNQQINSQTILSGKTIIITGANAGIGKATAADLAKRGARVIMACRDMGRAEKAAHDIIRDCQLDSDQMVSEPEFSFMNGNSHVPKGFQNGGQNVKNDISGYKDKSNHPYYPELVIKRLDLSDLTSVRAFAQDILATESRLDVLIANAGIMNSQPVDTTQGYEQHFGTNHLGHFYLTLLLLPLLELTARQNMSACFSNTPLLVENNDISETDKLVNRKRRNNGHVTNDNTDNNYNYVYNNDFSLVPSNVTNLKSRIVIVSSALHKRGELDFDDLKFERRGFTYWKAYSASKLANILLTKELARRLQSGKGLEPFLNPTKDGSPYAITVNSLHPGVVITEMSRNVRLRFDVGKMLFNAIGPLFLKNGHQGAQTSLYCALAPEIENISGEYFGDCQLEQSSIMSQDKELAQKLWDFSMSCIQKFELTTNDGSINQ